MPATRACRWLGSTVVNDPSQVIAAVYHWDDGANQLQAWLPGANGTAGTGDFLNLANGQSYWIQVNDAGSTTWTTAA